MIFSSSHFALPCPPLPPAAQVCALGEKGVPEATARQMLKALEAKSIDELASLCDGINPEAVDELRTLFQLAENYGFAVSRVCVCVCVCRQQR